MRQDLHGVCMGGIQQILILTGIRSLNLNFHVNEKFLFQTMGEIRELASQTETNTEPSQEDELSKILHWQGKEAKNHYKLY